MDAMGLVALVMTVDVGVADPGRDFEVRTSVFVTDFFPCLRILSKKGFISLKWLSCGRSVLDYIISIAFCQYT